MDLWQVSVVGSPGQVVQVLGQGGTMLAREGSVCTRSLKVQGAFVRVSHCLLECGHTGIEGKGGELVPPNSSMGEHHFGPRRGIGAEHVIHQLGGGDGSAGVGERHGGRAGPLGQGVGQDAIVALLGVGIG